jgi:hypothetical protein
MEKASVGAGMGGRTVSVGVRIQGCPYGDRDGSGKATGEGGCSTTDQPCCMSAEIAWTASTIWTMTLLISSEVIPSFSMTS